MKRLRLVILVVLACSLTGQAQQPARGAGSPLLAIVQSELQRNFEGLKKEPVPPYFISYTLHDMRTTRMSAAFGALQRSDEARNRFASVEVRVGDFTLDNTHPLRGDASAVASPHQRRLPAADRRAEADPPGAVAGDGSLVQAGGRSVDPRQDERRGQDQGREPGARLLARGTAVLHRRAGRLLGGHQGLGSASAPSLGALHRTIRSSSTATSRSRSNRTTATTPTATAPRLPPAMSTWRIFIQAMTKAADGMELPLYASYYARTPDGLPDEKQLTADTREMIALLAKLRIAPLVDPFSGPAILSGRAAGVFFHEIFGHRVEGSRQKNADDGQTFAKSVEMPVLPSFLSVVFDPTQRKLGNTELVGHYLYDDEGVKARRVTVVDKGVLKTFLLGRAPLLAFPQSNGHGRAQPGYLPMSRQSNLMVESSKTVTPEALMEMLGRKRAGRASRSACSSRTSRAASRSPIGRGPTPST